MTRHEIVKLRKPNDKKTALLESYLNREGGQRRLRNCCSDRCIEVMLFFYLIGSICLVAALGFLGFLFLGAGIK